MVAFTRSLPAASGTNGVFRTWGSQLSNDLAAMGLVKANDLGQINWSTVEAPTAGYQSVGYEIWRFDDVLQATAPVFFKIEYGSGTNGNSTPGIWVTPGTASNGLGIISGAPSRDALLSYYANTSPQVCVFSGNKNRVVIALFTSIDYSANLFSIERTKDSAGKDTNEGILYSFWGGFNGTSQYSRTYFIPFFGLVPLGNDSSGILTPSNISTGTYGDDIALYPNYHFKNGSCLLPGINLVGYFNNDVLANSTGKTFVYGTERNYYFLGANRYISPSARGGIANTCLAILYE